MIRRKDRNLHVVREQEDPTDRIVREILDELNSEDSMQQRQQKQETQNRKRKKLRRRLMLGIMLLVVVLGGVYLFVNLQTYGRVQVTDSWRNKGTASNSYREFADGILKFSRDGVSYLDQKGEEQWNHPYQIKNLFIDIGEMSAAVADKGGNDIFVIQKDGVKGEIHTSMPVERVSISRQGIVSAILKNDSSAAVMCYDMVGNVLVEHKTSSAGTGYPLDIALSSDGRVMQVLYFFTQEGRITSKVIYYNFGEAGEGRTDNQVSSSEYVDTVMASGFFLDESTSVAVGDNCLAIYRGKETPKEAKRINLDKEIKSVFHNKNYIGLILKNEGREGYELRLYNADGKVVISKNFTGDYSNVKLCGRQVIMYDGKKCSIFMRNGILKFDGEMDSDILEIFPIMGVNRYIVISADGIDKIRLVK